MSNLYRLDFSQQTLPFDENAFVYPVKSRSSGNPAQLYTFENNSLTKYEFGSNASSWQTKWSKQLETNDPTKNRILHFPTFENNDNILMVKTPEGIHYYQLHRNDSKLLSKSEDHEQISYHDAYDWNKPHNIIKIGHFFRIPAQIGVLTRHQDNGLHFYYVNREALASNRDPLWPVTTDLSPLGNYSSSDFFLADIKNKGQQSVISRNRHELNVYEFDENIDIKLTLQIAEGAKSDDTVQNLFFPNLTGRTFRDIVVFNKTGMFVYTYFQRQKNYSFLHYNSLFSEMKGWTDEHVRSVVFEDINSDGFEEMIFTGPRGIDVLLFDRDTNQWLSYFDDDQITITERYGKIKAVLPSTSSNNPIVFIHYAKQLLWANITTIANRCESEEIPYIPKENTPASSTSQHLIPQIAKTQSMEEKPVRLLRDDLDCSAILNAVDKYTGKVNFQLPLISFTSAFSNDIKLNFNYNGISQESTILGVGWSALPQDLITMDHRTSIYEDTESYYVVLDGLPTLLKQDHYNSNQNVYSFKISNNATSDTQIRYYKAEEKWEVKKANATKIYGRSTVPSTKNPVGWEVVWENWRGVGNSITDQTKIPTSWYLTELRDENKIMKLTYDIFDETLPRSANSFTREIYLKTISSQTPNNLNKIEITFEYSAKDNKEYDAPAVVDKNGYIRQQLVTSRYLKSYTVSTPNYQQKINFIYKTTNGKRLLTEIKQENDPTNKPVLSFDYKLELNSYLMEKATLPSEAQIEYNYELLDEVSPSGEHFGNIKLDVPATQINHKIDFTNGDVIVSSLNSGKIILQTFKQDETNASSISTIQPDLGQGKAKTYETVSGENYYAIVIQYTSETELHLFHKPDKIWIKTSEFTFLKNVQIKFGKDFILAFKKNSPIDIITWNKETKAWQMQNFKTDFPIDYNSANSFQVVIFDNTFIVYNNNYFWVGYKDQSQTWHSKKIKDMPGAMDCIKTTIDKFNLDEDILKDLLNTFEQNALQMYNNLFLLSRWCLKESQLFTTLDLFTLNKKHEIVKQQQFNIPHADLSKLEQTEEQQFTVGGAQKNYKLKLGYNLSGNKYKIILKEFPSSFLEDTRRDIERQISKAPQQDKEKALENQKDQFKKTCEKLFEKYSLLSQSQMLENIPVFKSPTVIIGTRSFTFTGSEWNEDQSAKTKKEQKFLVLGDKYILSKGNENSPINLYEGTDEKKLGKSLVNLGITDFNDIYIGYPNFVAYQEKSTSTTKVIKFLKNGNFNTTISLPNGEQLYQYSNQILVSKVGNSSLIFHQMFGLSQLLPNLAITKASIYLDKSNTRSIGYNYKSPKFQNNAVYYEKVSIVPGNDQRSFGWITEERYIDKSVEEHKIQYFDGQGSLIRTLPLKQDQKEGNNGTLANETTLYKNTTIFDVTGKMKVAEFFVNEVADEEVGYYGFEEYEENQIGPKNQTQKWIFTESDVIKNGFSFTGQSYLELSESILYGVFKPKNQNEEYIASCWIRPHNGTLIKSSITPILTANIQVENNREIYEHTRLGEIKYQIGNWYYVEVLVNFESAKDIPKFKMNTTTSLDKSEKLLTSIVVSPIDNSKVDVDHIRFSPMNSPFKATVYDINTMQVKDEIRQDGLIKRHIYDKHNKEIASFDEYGQLKELKTYTKASSIGKLVLLNSITQMEPESGFYESFAPSLFEKRWKIDTTNVWRITPNQLSHLTADEDNLTFNILEIDPKSYGIRMILTLRNNSFLKLDNGVTFQSNENIAEFTFLEKRLPMPLNSEIIIVLENTRLFIWVDGGIYFDGLSNNSSINIMTLKGEVKLCDVIVFNKPSIQIIYSNSLQEKVQKIKLENENTIILREYLYDELGRQTINIQPTRLSRSNQQSLLTYQSNFVTNKDPHSNNSVWKTGQLMGESQDILGAYGYSQTTYFNSPLNDKNTTGLPCKEFSIFGPYAKRFSPFAKNTYINNIYPENRNYTYSVEYKPGDVKHITVLDNKKNKVAKYIEIPKSKDVLSTYEYDDRGNVIKILPPIYHEKAQTLGQMFLSSNNTKAEHKHTQKSLGLFMTYNKNDDMLTKETPDMQKIEHIYDEDLLKFTIFHNQNNNLQNIVYYDYDKYARLYERGELKRRYSREELLDLKLTQNNTKVYQQFDYNDFEHDPMLRKKFKRVVTYNEGNPLIEEFTFTTDEKTLSKRLLLPAIDDEDPQMMELNKLYTAGKLKEIEYPINIQDKPFKLVHKYNKLGQMVSIGIPENENLFAQFTYNSAGQINTEKVAPNSNKNFTRQYNYNSAGFLTQIQDEFLIEDISYTEKSYGGMGYGDGTITSTKFEAKWHNKCNNENLKLNKYSFVGPGISPYESELCFNKLKEAEYLDNNGNQKKVFYSKLNQQLPTICSYGVGSYHIQKVLGLKGFPSHYGHSYDYGNHQELTKAKYFVGNEMPLPLQPDTFSKEIPTFNSTTSRDIWQILLDSKYILLDNEKSDFAFGHGKPGRMFIRPNMFNELGNISQNYQMYELPLQRIIVSCLVKKQKPPQIKSTIQNAINKWIYYRNEADIKQIRFNIINMLEKNSYLTNPFTDEFNTILEKYKSYIPEIVGVLQDHFGSQLGEAEFDVESYDIDANGNHKLFYTGFDRYQLEYKDNTNQINNLIYQSFSSIEGKKNFEMKHDNRGNVIQALHKGIQNIEYHPVSNRAVKIKLVDGRNLLFHYDMQGERILKKVVDNNGKTIYKIHYIRDESGKTLVEKKITYKSTNIPPDVLITTYIYGPRGLLGFYRHDEFYSVFADHEGSIRLVISGNEVVAAYDYLPYGNMMRKYGNDPDSHISYLYTGQEFDEETSLYNYHARFYDPSIGRFYQFDPKEQYFSPYKYAGNSPVSMIDPNGEWGWLIGLFKIIVSIIKFIAPVIYAYVGGVKANNNQLNPLKWDYSKGSTWTGIISGAKRGFQIGTKAQANPSTLPSAIGNAYNAVIKAKKNPNNNAVITAAEGFTDTYENPKQVSSGSSPDSAQIGSKIITQNGLSTTSDFSDSEAIKGLVGEVKLGSDLPKSEKVINDMITINNEDPIQKTISDITGKMSSIPYLNRNSKKDPNVRHRRSVNQNMRKMSISNGDEYANNLTNMLQRSTNQIPENQRKEGNIRRIRSIPQIQQNLNMQQIGEINTHQNSSETKFSTLMAINLKPKPKIIGNDAKLFSEGQSSNTDMQAELSPEASDTLKALQFVANIMEQYNHKLANFHINSWNFKYYNKGIQEMLRSKFKLNKAIWAEVSKNEAVAAFLSNRLEKPSFYHEEKYDYVFLKDNSNFYGKKIDNNTGESYLQSQAPTKLSNKNPIFLEKSIVKAATRSTKDISYITTRHIPQTNFIQPIPVRGCHQCKYTSYAVTTFTDFEPLTNTNQISKRLKLLPPSSKNTKITTFGDLVGSNYQSEKKRPKRSIYQSIDPDYSSFSNEIYAENSDHFSMQKNDANDHHTNKHSYDETNTLSSWMSNLFGWFKNSNSGSSDSSRDPNDTKSNATISQVGAQFDTNGTILLLDLLVRKATGEKFVPSKDIDELSLQEIQGDAISIITDFEEILHNAATKSSIPPENLTFDPIKMQELIIDQLRYGQFSKIPKTLYSYVKEANPDFGNNASFLKNFKHELEKFFNKKNHSKPISIQRNHRTAVKIQVSNQHFNKASDTITHNLSSKSNFTLIN